MSEPRLRGKVGLALSGGGFRAAFFHVGVLARLAELHILPKVQVVSTVSGGSIVGAAYYLVLKNRLEDAGGEAISDEEYVDLVKKVESRLLAAVRKNIRGRIFANPLKTIWMASPGYSRSSRIGDLYDRYLYKGIWKERPDASRHRKWMGAGPEEQIAMHELQIEPRVPMNGADPPIFWMNATSLNSGHNWRFGTRRMGEPLPESLTQIAVVEDVDKNVRLMPGYYEPGAENPGVGEGLKAFPLAHAVAASACVPVLFHPLSISGMYEGIRVALVDGGVQDNQGIQGLRDQRCTYLIISDASGQLEDQDKPSTLVPSVAGRTMGVSGDRIRDEQLTQARTAGKKMALLHLRKGVAGKAVAPGESDDPPVPEPQGGLSSADFGVHPEVQQALSRIRTDLDYFSDSEAFSLMLDGYLMSDKVLAQDDFEAVRFRDAPPKDPRNWDFGRELQDVIGRPPSGIYRRQLVAAEHRFLRTVALLLPGSPWRYVGALVAVLVAIVVLLFNEALGDVWSDQWSAKAVILVLGGLLLVIAAYLATAIQAWPIRYTLAILWGLLMVVPAMFLSVVRLLARPWRHVAAKLGEIKA